ncbi:MULTISPECIES: DNA cytosine methyltransferase [Limnospira]|uniref:Cytosine-specific methyltransferase n=2 Tax=Limnospira TaxID=2596745 RepID=A0A9P1NYQ9_9CYAN|nr:DNA cytosine methyltransferase [Limnospira indica]CDM95087.1 Modification methylase M.Asp8005ORF360 (Cytosine-specific methyltransferase) [Limnospira indica PCC 8005]
MQTDLFNLEISQPKFTFVDLFSGIGGFRIALENWGGKCLGYSEIAANSIQVYKQNFIRDANLDEPNLGDMRSLHKLPFTVDLITGGVPCQPWSIAGKLRGLDDPRGQLWLDTIRVIKMNQPLAFILENVKGLTDPRHRPQFESILEELSAANYHLKWQVINASDFGLPQDRDRVFIVGIRRDINQGQNFQFPQPLNLHPKLFDFVEGVSQKPVIKKKFSPQVLFGNHIPPARGRFQKNDELNDFFLFSDVRNGQTTIHSWDLIETSDRQKQICDIILKNRRKKIYGPQDGNPIPLAALQQLINDLQESELNQLIDQRILRYVENRGYEFVNSKISSGINGVAKIYLAHAEAIATLTATGTKIFVATKYFNCQNHQRYKQEFIKTIYHPQKYKEITPRDTARLQGFPDWFVLHQNPSIAKKQLGNAVPVPVVDYIVKSLLPFIWEA